MHELNRGGVQNTWPAWAGQMIDSSRLPGHVGLPAPQAAQMAALLANENCRELYRCNSIRWEETEELAAWVDQYDLLLPSLLNDEADWLFLVWRNT